MKKTLYQNVSTFGKYYDIPSIVQLIKQLVFYTFFDGIIAVLIIQAFFIYTKFPNTDFTFLNIIVALIVPICIALAIILLVILGWCRLIINAGIKYARAAEEETKNTNSKTAFDNYKKKCDKIFTTQLIFPGMLSYCFVGLVSVYIVFNFSNYFSIVSYNFLPSKYDYILVLLMCFGFGVLFNLERIFAFKRINWIKIITIFSTNDFDCMDEDNRKKYFFYVYAHTIVSIVLAFYILLLIVLIVLNINDYAFDKTDDLTTSIWMDNIIKFVYRCYRVLY